MNRFQWVLCGILMAAPAAFAAKSGGFFSEGVSLYQAGRFSEATESFELAVKKRDNPKEAQNYIERIRRETVERIRNKALTGISKNTWQNKYLFMNSIDNRVRVGISLQEVFDRGSANFRPGAVEALYDLSNILRRSDSATIEIELINEIAQDEPPPPDILNQQLAALFAYLSQSALRAVPRY